MATVGVRYHPWDFFGTFIIANPLLTIKDTGLALMDAILDRAPKQRNYLDVLGVLYTLMRELRGKARNGRTARGQPDRVGDFQGFFRRL
jgi:chemotaxis protein MotA